MWRGLCACARAIPSVLCGCAYGTVLSLFFFGVSWEGTCLIIGMSWSTDFSTFDLSGHVHSMARRSCSEGCSRARAIFSHSASVQIARGSGWLFLSVSFLMGYHGKVLA